MSLNIPQFEKVHLRIRHVFKSSKILRGFFLRNTASKSKTGIFVSSKVENPDQVVHLLIVGSRHYVLLAETCLWSFLNHHPSTRFHLHVDENLIPYLRRRFEELISKGLIEITLIENSVEDWQALKLQIILGMNGSTDYFMDADLRWNNKMPDLRDVTAYLEEFDMTEPYLPTPICALFNNKHSGKMMNLSFFTFAGIRISEEICHEIATLQKQISILSWNENLSPQIREKCRMSEQIALSFGLNSNSYRISSLKSTDSRNDGQFVESCYFGATGLTF